MALGSLLLQNGTVLQHRVEQVQASRNTDVLIVNDRIAQIGSNLSAANATVLDCSDKIISPGLIDCHHHMWQTQLKGRHGDHTFLDYVTSANLQAINFTAEDLFWGQLSGCLEALDAGTTCVIDNAHMSAGPGHGSAALKATVTSRIRSVFCYGVTPFRVSEWTLSTLEMDRTPFPSWFFDQFESLARQAPFGKDGRVRLGFFFDSYFLPRESIVDIFHRVRSWGVNLITSHFRHWSVSSGQSKIPEILESASLLGPDVLLSHGNGATPSQAEILTSAGMYIASTPDAEVFMASGKDPVAFHPDLLTCLGADCHSCGPGSMLHQMQIAIASDRAAQTSDAFEKNQYPKEFRAKVERAFNLVTINAARAVQMEDEIGSLAIGKLADVVVFDADTPVMACAAEFDPLVAVVRHAGLREINTVIVGGEIVKQEGKLSPVVVDEEVKSDDVDVLSGATLTWKQVASKLIASQESIQQRIQGVNIGLARKVLFSVFGKTEEELLV
ncbi:hypothetical protein N7492_005268 [Penicillium capsulatum]|uniref:Amidohydrolase-related domain-containing protein n=1 Tax=Penicillium capsulatum TaxID=69766 RepID=A0A9W9LRR3_9EURO|nr:hypothetical protein N7492_005268 [Penicillium capsulatum]KAJ6135626.1 hypothetical protein N7512_000786 [Penicillium capsulatum]